MRALILLLSTFLVKSLIAQGDHLNLLEYYPFADQNEWRYVAPEGWKDGDYISKIEEDEARFRKYYKKDETLKKVHSSAIQRWDESQFYLHYDATKAAKMLVVNSDGIYHVGEIFAGGSSFLLFNQPILWFSHHLQSGDQLQEERTYHRFYPDGKSDSGIYRIEQEIVGIEAVETSSGNYAHCLRVDSETFWQLSDNQTAQSINTYHYAHNVGVVKASARFIINTDGVEVINRLIETDIKKFSLQVNALSKLSASEIISKAHKHAGGAFWSRPTSLTLSGHGYFYKDGKTFFHEDHKMYRVFESKKEDAHKANGKVRIESYRNGAPIIMVTFDGENTYDLNGKRPKSEADQQWASNFGYGAIRHALDDGYKLERMPDDRVDGHPAFIIKVIDQKEGSTFFGIRHSDYKIVKVAFDTPRGWHERIYSDFFTKDEYDWQQSGRIRLFYNGIKSNEIIWTDFDVNTTLPDDLFRL